METKKQYKSFRYRNDLVWKSGRRGVMSSLGKPELEVGSPPEFKGEPGIWTPEEMYVGALNACLMLTFLAFADRKDLGLVAYEASAEGLLEQVEGRYRITEVTVQPREKLWANWKRTVSSRIRLAPGCGSSPSIEWSTEVKERLRSATKLDFSCFGG